jgi:hypothetical protein
MSEQAAVIGSKIQSSFAASALRLAWSFRVQALLVCGAGFLSVLLGPDNNWDLRYYHLYAPWAYLHHRYLYDIGPAQYQGFFNPTADFLFYALASSRLNDFPRVIAFAMGTLHGINAALIYSIASHVLRPAQRVESPILPVVAVLVGISGAGFVSLLGTTTNDLIGSIFVLAVLLGVLKLAERAGGPADWAWPGLWLGIALGLKYTAIVFLPGLLLVAVIAAGRQRTVRGLMAFGAASALGFAAAAGHHLLTLWSCFGNPLFPLFNNIFQSPYYDPVALHDGQFIPRDLWQTLAFPWFWTQRNSGLVSEIEFRDWRGAIASAALAAGLITLAVRYARKKRFCHEALAQTRGLGLLFVFVIVSLFVWEFSFSIYRYAVTLEMLSGVVTVGAVIWLFPDQRWRLAVSLAALTLAGATTVYPDWGRGSYGDKYIDVRVPPLPANSVVLIATWEPAAYFIPFAEPGAQYVGIENNYLQISQSNRLAAEVKRLMRTPGRAKFVVTVDDNRTDLNALLKQFGLGLSAAPCQPIRSNLEIEALSLCAVEAER